MNAPSVLRLLASAALGTVVVGCSSAVGGAGPTSTQQSQYPPYGDVGEVDAQLNLVYRAIEGYQGDDYTATYYKCMADAGFDIPAAVRPARRPSAAVADSIAGTPAFEAADLDAIAEFGYEIPSAGTTVDDVDLADSLTGWIQALSPAEQERYSIADGGTGENVITVEAGGLEITASADGCDAEATRAEMGDLEAYVWANAETNDLNRAIISATDSSETYVAALTAWQECVSAQGYELSDPGEMTGSVDQAVADRACRDQVGLTAVRNQARLDAANGVRDRLNELAISAQATIDR